ncbi:MAG: hypothetical protein ACM65M_22065 [Microcoleus sp.]
MRIANCELRIGNSLINYEHLLLAALPDFSFISGALEAAESYQTEI